MTSQPPSPPADPEEWTDEQWLDWLNQTDPDHSETSDPPRAAARWRDRRPSRMLGAAMLGAHQAIYGHQDDEPVIVAEAPGGPPDDDLPEVVLDPEHPERSRAIFRTSDPGARSGP